MAVTATEIDILKTKLSEINVSVLSKTSSKHSFCWNYFGQLIVDIDGKKRTVLGEQIFCGACLKREKDNDCEVLFSKARVKVYSKNIATSNLLRHLKDEHNLEDHLKAKVVPIKEFFSVQRKSKPVLESSEAGGRKDKRLLARDLALWFARSLMPFDSIDDEAMRDFLKKYNIVVADEDLPSRQNIAREGLEDVYNSMLAYIKGIIQQQNIQFGAVTSDLWTDQFRRRNYITCTFHFISNDMHLMKFTLATKQVTGKHSGEKIKKEIHDILQEFLIPRRDIVLVTDSGSNMKRAANLLNMKNHLCLGHALHNLVTVDGIQSTDEILSLITKCKKIVKHLRYRAPQLEAAANEEQRELLLSLETIGEHSDNTDDDSDNTSADDDRDDLSTTSLTTGAPPTIKTSTPTRWHSMLMMLTSIAHSANRRPIRDMLIDIDRSALLLNENEYNMILYLTTFLEKFKTIVDILSSESQSTINLALVFKSEIRRLLEECSDREPVVITKMKNNMLQKLEHRFPGTDLIVAATLLDCRFHSIKEIDACMESRETTKVQFLSKMVKSILKDEDFIDSTAQGSHKTPEPSTSKTSFLFDLAKLHSSAQFDVESDVENECWKYFSTATVKDLQPYNDNVLEFWKDRQVSFPFLSKLVRAILFVPATSTPSERVFSVTGQIITAKRSRLNPLRINRIMFIHDNYGHCKTDTP